MKMETFFLNKGVIERMSDQHEQSFSKRKEALEGIYDTHNFLLWNIIYGNLQDERHAEEILTSVFRDVWNNDQVLFTKDKQLIFILQLCKHRLSSKQD